MTSVSGDPAAECYNLHCVTQLGQTIAGLPSCIKAVGDDPTTNPLLQQYMLRSKPEIMERSDFL